MTEKIYVRLSDSFRNFGEDGYHYVLSLCNRVEFENEDGSTDFYYKPIFQKRIDVREEAHISDFVKENIRSLKDHAILAIENAEFSLK